MQMDGTDIFMGTFSMLKKFDFFNVLKNWFLPFYASNKELQEELSKEPAEFDKGTFTESLEAAPFICNSDKYDD